MNNIRKFSPPLVSKTTSGDPKLDKAFTPAVVRREPSKGWVKLNLHELWEYRHLLYFFVWRDIKIRYKQTILGGSWAIVQPLMTMVIFSIFFGRLAKIPSDGIPYPLFSFAALVPWTYFANALGQGSNSLVMHAEMLKKIYFPRLTMPLAAVLAGLVDFALAFIVLLGMMIFYGYMPTLKALWVVPLILLATVTALGVSLWLAALNVQFRDVRYIVPFSIQAWFFVTPIVYASTLLPEPWRLLLALNPMAGVIEGFRWALLETGKAPDAMLALSTLMAVVVLISGLYYFRRMEKTFADVA
jgi:lipopolysaccharide transport system permease protein